MNSARRAIVASLVAITLSMPLSADAANVFGGKVGAFLPCLFTSSIWVTVGPPRGGIYVWSPGTRTYPYGPPSSGRYTIGLFSVPSFCVWLISPLEVATGILMTMEASSR